MYSEFFFIGIPTVYLEKKRNAMAESAEGGSIKHLPDQTKQNPPTTKSRYGFELALYACTRKLSRCIGETPSRRQASLCALVGYPLCLAYP